ncbi:MAG: hypothetical protein JWO37_2788 [Acidimicrobiales bacterium]|jgi:uncharacterized protein YukE|nr:hypothetical protein [Acidimicrobiales bacterium]
MGADMWGGNLDQMQTLDSTFTSQAQAVADLTSRIASTLHGTAWTGPAADRFRLDWSGQFQPALQKLGQALTDNATIVRNRRAAIETATR